MRRMFLGLLFFAFLWGPPAFPKDEERTKPLPLFMDPEFSFSQVGTICLAPILDLRTDKTVPLILSGKPRVGGKNSNQLMAALFKDIGYQTVECNPVSATLSDLTAPSDTWLRNLDLGQSSWLFVLAVEDLRTSYGFFGGSGGYKTGDAVVSGFLFKKGAAGAKLVWRDRTFGILPLHQNRGGGREFVEIYETLFQINEGVAGLLAEFDPRSKPRWYRRFAIDEKNIGAGCDAVWDRLKDALNNDAKKYKVAFMDASDRMALYTVHHQGFRESENTDHVVLKTHGDACLIQVTQSFRVNAKEADDWNDLVREVQASLSK